MSSADGDEAEARSLIIISARTFVCHSDRPREPRFRQSPLRRLECSPGIAWRMRSTTKSNEILRSPFIPPLTVVDVDRFLNRTNRPYLLPMRMRVPDNTLGRLSHDDSPKFRRLAIRHYVRDLSICQSKWKRQAR
ncbi:hypothetical protein V9T40_004598 [Parthenolecanium corni]|uniref:Uncharacterized protein n=1 Tax=Parthenolecanium corni TaxID=536013 RepID=A0AAN9YB52_9HEMI